MQIRLCKFSLSILIFSNLPTNFLAAQSPSSSGVFSTTLVIVAALVFLAAVYVVSENLLGLEAKRYGINGLGKGDNFFKRFFRKKAPAFVDGPYTRLIRGHNILLKGEATKEKILADGHTFAVQPGNFIGMSPIPKLVVEKGQEVLAGEEIFFDKKRPRIKYVSPVSGEIAEVNRGEKRSIKEVVILADKDQKFRELPQVDLETIGREELVEFLLESGAWPLLKQRPYDIVANPDDVPENIFVSTFDTAPLAPDLDFIITGQEKPFEKGIELLTKLTQGKVFLGLNANGSAPNPIFTKCKGAEKQWFSGPHPAGNVGVQIHHIAPVSNGKEAWVLGVQDVITMGKLITDRRFDASRIIAVTGQALSQPRYVETKVGAKISDLLKGESLDGDLRFISGDVLSGKAKQRDGFVNFYDDQVTIIPEGREYELFGWLLPFKMRPSISRTFPGFLFKNTKYEVNTNTHGEERAFVMSGQYEQVLPMDIYPQHLMKAIVTKDFEKMEGLGIYELNEEDVALCEFVCTSKQPLQHILRSGLELMREQG